jgi:alkylation response protein AidB-like acyl-CoA dehydrogenase
MNQIVSETKIQFSAPVTASSPELQKLIDIIALTASERDRDRIHPYDAVELIRHARLGALRLPVEQGGGGASVRELYEVALRLAAADSNVAHVLRNHYTFVERFVINQQGEKNRKWLKAVADGAIFAIANTELDSKQVGAVEVKTSLTPDGDGYRLNGTKYYSTGSLYADYVLIRARRTDGVDGSVIVPAHREGVSLVDDWDGMGQRVTGSGTTVLNNVRVEKDEVIFEPEGSFYTLPYASTVAQLFVTGVNAGILRAILRDATALVQSRNRPFYFAPADRPSNDPILQQTVGLIASYASAAELSVLHAADALDGAVAARAKGLPDEALSHEASLRAAKAKVIVDELALRAGSLLFDVGGASTTRQSHNLDRHWRNVRTLASHNPTAYKARAIGDYEINRTPLPNKGFF